MALAMLAAILNVEHLVKVSGYPLLFLLVMAESSGLPIPGETALIAASVLASGGTLADRGRDRARGGRRDRRRQHRLPDRAQGRSLDPGTARRVPRAAPAGARHGPAVLRTPRPEGRVLRALRARAAGVGLVAGGRHPHAVALVPGLERPRRDLLGGDHRHDRLPARAAPPATCWKRSGCGA